MHSKALEKKTAMNSIAHFSPLKPGAFVKSLRGSVGRPIFKVSWDGEAGLLDGPAATARARPAEVPFVRRCG
jgi:hypothetical protein